MRITAAANGSGGGGVTNPAGTSVTLCETGTLTGTANVLADSAAVKGYVDRALPIVIGARITSNQTIANDTETTAVWNSAIYDPQSMLNTGTGEITIPADFGGLNWDVRVNAYCQGISAGDAWRIAIYTNSTEVLRSIYNAGATASARSYISGYTLIGVPTGTVVKATLYQNFGGDRWLSAGSTFSTIEMKCLQLGE